MTKQGKLQIKISLSSYVCLEEKTVHDTHAHTHTLNGLGDQ